MKNSFRIQIPSIIFCYFFLYFFNPVTISTQTIIDKIKDLPVASGEYVDGVKDSAPIHHGHQHLCLVNIIDTDVKQVLINDDKVG